MNDSSSNPLLSQEISLYKRIETLEAWVKSYVGGVPNNTLGFTMSELEGRLLKRITNLETQLTKLNVQELPNRQQELEGKVDKLLQMKELPSFGTSISSKAPTSLELRLNKMEINQENLVSENKKLQARLNTLEESRNLTTIRQIMDRLDSVIRVVNDHESESYQVGQSINDIQQELNALRQVVDAWNEDDQQEPQKVEHQEDNDPTENISLPYKRVITRLNKSHLDCQDPHLWLGHQPQLSYQHLNYPCLREANVFLFATLICS